MDGTLLDLKFDNDFWQQHVPVAFAEKNGITLREAKDTLFARMMELRGQLKWYSVDFWADETGLDIVGLKRQHRHEISIRPGVVEFLTVLKRNNKAILLVTNAHPTTLEIKFARTAIGDYFDHVVSSHDYGAPKEDQRFWSALCDHHDLQPGRCLFIDDSPAVLASARTFGIGQILYVDNPDSSQAPVAHPDFINISGFDSLVAALQ